MLQKPVLIIMAAGMGSRFGGPKQIEPVGSSGEIIVDFSLYDALRAGFEKAIFIIKKDIEADIRSIIGSGAGKHMDIEYVFQELEDLPDGYSVPEGRTKPWGTSHAVMASRDAIGGPFAVINADDYYGPNAFRHIFSHLTAEGGAGYRYAMAGYRLKNTITENGYVSRGVCHVGEDGCLTDIDERKKIMIREGGIAYTEDDSTWMPLDGDSVVSMNFWGFSEDFMTAISDGFPAFLDRAIAENPLAAEYLLPEKVDELIKSGRASVKVLETEDRWHGVTYREDRDSVVSALQALKDNGVYPEKLWK